MLTWMDFLVYGCLLFIGVVVGLAVAAAILVARAGDDSHKEQV